MNDKMVRQYTGKMTLSEAARRAKLSIWDMEAYLVEKGFKSSYSIDDLRQEFKLLS